MAAEASEIDYSLNNPDTLTKYNTGAQISQKVLGLVTELCIEGAKIIEVCEKGDKLLEEEVAKVFKGKKIQKGIAHPTTVSPSTYVTPYTPLISDTEEASITIKAGEVIKIQLGAQIDGFGTIVCDSIIVPSEKNKNDVIPARQADLLLATYYANELLLRLMIPPGTLATGSEEERKKASAEKPPTQAKMGLLLEKIAKSYNVNVVQNTTSWLFDRNEIEAKKKIIVASADGMKGEGTPEVGEVWGVEVGMSLGSGKVKDFTQRSTLHRRTATTYLLKRPSSRQILSEIVKKFGTFPFSLRQLENERDAKVGVVECVRSGVLREYKPAGEADGSPVARLLTTVAITKNGLTRLAAPPAPDIKQFKTENKITDEEILKILERPVAKSTGSKSKNKKKKKKTAKKASDEEEGESSEEEFLVSSNIPDNNAANADSRPNNPVELCIEAAGGIVAVSFTPAGVKPPQMATLRNLRNSSRMSSPFTQPPRQPDPPVPNEKSKEESHSLSDVWEEPPVRTPAASFEDVPGLDRHGVLEYMAPLGTLPNQKILQRLKVLGPRPPNRFASPATAAPISNDEEGIIVPTNGYTSVETPSPANLSPRSDSVKADDMLTRASSARARASESAPDPPSAPGPAPAPAAALPSVSQPPRNLERALNSSSTPVMSSSLPTKAATQTSNSTPAPTASSNFSSATSPTAGFSTTFSREIMKYNTKIAVDLAEAAGKPGTALALQRFYAASASQTHVLRALDRIFSKRDDRRDRKLLKNYIKAADAEIAAGLHRRNSKSTNSPIIASPMAQSLPPSNRHAPPVNHAPPRQASPALQSQPQLHRLDTSLSQPEHRRATPSRNGSSKSSESSTVVVASAEPVTAIQEPTPVDADAVEDGDQAVRPGELSVPRGGRGRRSRSRSASTSSSLSSAQSLDAEIYAPAIEVGAQTPEAGDAKGAATTERRQAPTRGAPLPDLPPLPSAQNSHSPVSRPAYSYFPTVNQKAERRRHTKDRRPPLSEEERAQLEEARRQLHASTYEHSTDPQLTALRQNIDSHRSQIRPPVDEDREPANDPRAAIVDDRAPIVHIHAPSFSHHLDDLSSPPSSPMIAVSPAFPQFPNLRNGVGRKRPRTDFEDDDAETPASSGPGDHLLPPYAGGSSSRAGTPKVNNRPAKKIKKSARIMISPQKNKTVGVTAGMSRTTRSMRDNDTTNAADTDEEENNDFCSACGGNGELLCCDGCPNSFHFTCADPPINPKQPPEGEWFCSTCQARHNRRNRPDEQINQLFSRLFGRLDNANPKSFALPSEVRGYFEGVTTGEAGEYAEVVVNRQNNEPFRINRLGAPEEPDYKKLRDRNDKAIVCAACNLTTDDGKREIVPCDFCPARFHIDCLDPPLAVPPRRRPGDKPSNSWRCPLHTTDLIQNIRLNRSAEHIKAVADHDGLIVRQPKLRRPKDAIPKDVSLVRGFPNNGLIEVELMPEIETNFEEIDMEGTVYRLPEEGVRLDFVNKVKRSWHEDDGAQNGVARKRTRTDRYLPTSLQASTMEAQQDYIRKLDRVASEKAAAKVQMEAAERTQVQFRARTLKEQRATLNLLALSARADGQSMNATQSANGFDTGTTQRPGKTFTSIQANNENEGQHDDLYQASVPKGKIEELTQALVSEAPDEVVEEMEMDERKALEIMMERAQARLRVLNSGGGKKGQTAAMEGVIEDAGAGVSVNAKDSLVAAELKNQEDSAAKAGALDQGEDVQKTTAVNEDGGVLTDAAEAMEE